MEFRQVIHSVCRSAATAARPSLARTRPSPAAILFQHHVFTTNNKQQSEAAAAAVAPQQQSHAPPPPPPAPANPPNQRTRAQVFQLRNSLQANKSTTAPPRPPLLRRGSFSEDPLKKRPLFGRNTILTGQAPTNVSADSLFSPNSMAADMERSTSGEGLAPFSRHEFDNGYLDEYRLEEAKLRLRPSTGRTIHIQGNVDLARGLRLLGRAVAQNGIKKQVYLAKAHERPALKRKRQKRERWQERFKVGFRAAINRTMELKAQGW